ncbi:hypothetical protein [Burkholderia sp. PAMC 28687]|uniref:hypothetical protein n=1 Tax=Burkholderia sp. PAMC 28687 TaxID=1795874 RepID=UPI0012D778E4|nr:hypothetical protein [Burkholderia sp. PAMC 28687]
MIFPLPALMTSSGMITAPDKVVPALEGGSAGTIGGGELLTMVELLAGEDAPADVLGGTTEPPPADADAEAADAPAALLPDPEELLRPAPAVESEPPPPPHALTLKITPLTMETSSTLSIFIIINMLRNDENPPQKCSGARCFQIKLFPRIFSICRQRYLQQQTNLDAQFFIPISNSMSDVFSCPKPSRPRFDALTGPALCLI